MSSASRPPAKVPSPAPQEPQGKAGGEALFSTLLATRPPKQRRLGPFAVAALLHIPLVFWAWFAHVAPRIETWQREFVRPILLEHDNPAPIIVTPAPARSRAAAAEPAPAGPTRALPSQVTPGLPDPGPVTVPPAAEPTGPPTGSRGGAGRSLADRLAPPAPNPLLLGPLEEAPPVGVEAARSRLAERLRAYNDSLAAEFAAAERATDWTVTDKDGKRWGVSPGKLHLGNITLPLPLAFAAPAGRRDEFAARTRTYNEIEQQAARGKIKDSFEERVRLIRERKDRERREAAEKKKAGSN